jgi:hypothetical protein
MEHGIFDYMFAFLILWSIFYTICMFITEGEAEQQWIEEDLSSDEEEELPVRYR